MATPGSSPSVSVMTTSSTVGVNLQNSPERGVQFRVHENNVFSAFHRPHNVTSTEINGTRRFDDSINSFCLAKKGRIVGYNPPPLSYPSFNLDH
jgi:hypothetical protein